MIDYTTHENWFRWLFWKRLNTYKDFEFLEWQDRDFSETLCLLDILMKAKNEAYFTGELHDTRAKHIQTLLSEGKLEAALW